MEGYSGRSLPDRQHGRRSELGSGVRQRRSG